MVTIDDVVRLLSPDEANLNEAAAALGPESVPHLETLLSGPDPMLAAKAAYVASRIRDPRAIEVLRAATTSSDRMVRLAAATAVQRMSAEEAAPLVATFLADPDPEIRGIAVASVPEHMTPDMHDALQRLASADPYPYIRDRSAGILRRSSGR